MAHLYRHFDRDGVLLYVGISLDAIQRLQAHRSSAVWFGDIAFVSIERFPDRASAARAEITAIHTEHPAHNKNGVPGIRPGQARWSQDQMPNNAKELILNAARAAVIAHGGVRKAAAAMAINYSLLSRLASGARCTASEPTLNALGLTQRTVLL